MKVVALGADPELAGFVLAGVRVVPTTSAEQVRAAWRELDEDVGLVLLSPDALDAVRDELDARPTTLTAVIP